MEAIWWWRTGFCLLAEGSAAGSTSPVPNDHMLAALNACKTQIPEISESLGKHPAQDRGNRGDRGLLSARKIDGIQCSWANVSDIPLNESAHKLSDSWLGR